ncbi:MAG: type II toxin-antitoxin system PemK/MazF family toxin [Deltaproteobacteria bacterium]|nr:type II toxin-antitoxin system PemK/MazF family toxin [Deltaproteobacteria bacterium]
MDPVFQVGRGDVVLVPFPYVTDFKKAKTRPALVIQNDTGNRFGSTVIVALISSSMPEKRYPMHYPIPCPSVAAKAAGLQRPSVVKMETLITLPRRAILKRLGALPREAMREADTALAFSLDLPLATQFGKG